MRDQDTANLMIMAGGTLYLIGSTGLITVWNESHLIDTPSAATLYLGLLTICIGIMIGKYRLIFKAIALMVLSLGLVYGFLYILSRLGLTTLQ